MAFCFWFKNKSLNPFLFLIKISDLMKLSFRKKEEKPKEIKKESSWYRVIGVPEDIIPNLDLPGLSYRAGMKSFYFEAETPEALNQAKEKIGKYVDINQVKIEKI